MEFIQAHREKRMSSKWLVWAFPWSATYWALSVHSLCLLFMYWIPFRFRICCILHIYNMTVSCMFIMGLLFCYNAYLQDRIIPLLQSLYLPLRIPLQGLPSVVWMHILTQNFQYRLSRFIVASQKEAPLHQAIGAYYWSCMDWKLVRSFTWGPLWLQAWITLAPSFTTRRTFFGRLRLCPISEIFCLPRGREELLRAPSHFQFVFLAWRNLNSNLK